MSAVPSQAGFVVELEQEVLGAIINGNDFRRVQGQLRAEHFVEPLHQILFSYIKQAYDRYGTVNPVIVNKLIPVEEARAIGTGLGTTVTGYLANLAAGTVRGPANIERSVKMVVEQWARIGIAAEAGRVQAAANDPNANPLELIAKAGQAFDEYVAAVRSGPTRKTRVTLSAAAENAFAAAEEARRRGSGLTGITWGLTDVNAVTGGIQRRDLTLLAGRPGMGKTTIALSALTKAAKSGAGVGFISLEMDSDKLAARAISDIAYDWNVKVPYSDIIRGRLDEGQIASLREATKDLDQLPIIIEEQSGLSMSDVRVKAEAMMEEFDRRGRSMDVLCIDHLGLIKPSSRYSGNRVQEISEITALSKAMAREYNIAVILLSQLNRAVESRDDKRPQLSDLRDSGSIEQDADMIAFLFREAYYLERDKASTMEKESERVCRLADVQNKLEFIIAKNRHGPVKTIDLFAEIACSAVRNGARYQ